MEFHKLVKEKIRGLYKHGVTTREIEELESLSDFFQFAYEINPEQYQGFRDFLDQRVIKNSSLAQEEKEQLINNTWALEVMEHFFNLVPDGVKV